MNSLKGETFSSADGFLESQGEVRIIKMNFRKCVVIADNKWIWSVQEHRDELWHKKSSSLTLSSNSSLRLSSDGCCVGLTHQILEEMLNQLCNVIVTYCVYSERDSRSETISGTRPRCNKAGLELRTFFKRRIKRGSCSGGSA